jgi:hypothetical protein
MKKILLIFVLMLSAIFYTFSQTVNDVPIQNIDVEYIQIVGTSKFMSNKVSIQIDFGQENNYWTEKDTKIKDKNGKVIDFNSMIDALNFMSKNGYEFIQAYAFAINNQNIYHYLMRKKK